MNLLKVKKSLAFVCSLLILSFAIPFSKANVYTGNNGEVICFDKNKGTVYYIDDNGSLVNNKNNATKDIIVINLPNNNDEKKVVNRQQISSKNKVIGAAIICALGLIAFTTSSMILGVKYTVFNISNFFMYCVCNYATKYIFSYLFGKNNSNEQ